MSESSGDPEIAPTVSFRHDDLDIRDQIVAEHQAGVSSEKAAKNRGKAPDLLPPYPERAAPKEPLAARLRKKVDRGRD